jgi:hypothetical protein
MFRTRIYGNIKGPGRLRKGADHANQAVRVGFSIGAIGRCRSRMN